MNTPNAGSTPRDFALRVLKHMKGAGVHDAAYDPDEFLIRYGGMTLYLGAIFQEIGDRSPGDQDRWMKRFIPAIARPAAPRRWDEVRSLLRPVVRRCTFMLDDPTPRLRRPALAFVDEMVAVDLPDVLSFPAESELTEWGVPADEVFAAARQNLAAQVAPQELPPDAVSRIVVDDPSYLPTWLLLPGWLASSTRSYRHRPVAFMPDHTTLIVAPADPDLIGPLFEAVEDEFRNATRPLSPQGYTLDGSSRLVPLDQALVPPPPAARRARALMAMTEYSSQKTWLQEQYDEDFEGLFFGDLLVTDRGDCPATLTIWGEGVSYALPEADLLSFISADRQSVLVVPFQRAVEMTGIARMPRLRPPRYRTNGWPAPTALARLAEFAASPMVGRGPVAAD